MTGLIDAVSFLGLGSVFTATMTGNAVLLGFAVVGVPGLSVTRSLLALGGFLVGAACGGRLGTVMASATRRRWLLSVAVTEAGLIFAAALASLGFDIGSPTPVNRLYAVIVLTAVAMGLRNATVRRLAVPDGRAQRGDVVVGPRIGGRAIPADPCHIPPTQRVTGVDPRNPWDVTEEKKEEDRCVFSSPERAAFSAAGSSRS